MIEPSEQSESFAMPAERERAPARNPLRALLDLFSSVWLGVALLSLLFVYSSIGSSGVPVHPNVFDPANWISVRQLRPFEMTEFEWFHWWPFDVLIALICVNLVVATLRRIPFNVLNLGVWMIHSGIIMLALGSVWYFGTKVEGEAPVIRRRLVIEAPGAPPASIPALPGAAATIGEGDNRYSIRVANIDPRWQPPEAPGQSLQYKVSVLVQGKGGVFVRELVANQPAQTQDLILTEDQNQPVRPASATLGRPLVDEALKVTLEYEPQPWFYLVDTRAIYLRETDETGRPKSPWIERPVHGLPRYNDRVASLDDVWLGDPLQSPTVNALSVRVPKRDEGDPIPDIDLRATQFLRYASLETRHRIDPAGPLDPRVSVTIAAPGQSRQYDLAAFDRVKNQELEGNLLFVWATDQAQIDRLKTRIDPVIRFTFPQSGRTFDETILATMESDPNLPFKPLDDTGYAYRVERLDDQSNFAEGVRGVAIVQIQRGDRTFTRWVFTDPAMNRDLAMTADPTMQHQASIPTDSELQSEYRPGVFPPAPMIVVAGPAENDLAVILTLADQAPRFTSVMPGGVVELINGVTLRIDRYAPRTRTETRPLVIPEEQRDRQMGEMMAMICVEINERAAGSQSAPPEPQRAWLSYHHYAFESADQALRRFPYRPTRLALSDGRQIEMIYSRQRRPLPAPVVLDDFVVDTHIGGFTGDTSSIMDWKSLVRFADDDGAWRLLQEVRVNHPARFGGYSFFQAQWDPPDPARQQGDIASAGLNYTVLGVGNRHGVNVMLAGCVIAVIGMIYTFYGRPLIKRRRQQVVYERVRNAPAARHDNGELPAKDGAWEPAPRQQPEPEPAGAAPPWRSR